MRGELGGGHAKGKALRKYSCFVCWGGCLVVTRKRKVGVGAMRREQDAVQNHEHMWSLAEREGGLYSCEGPKNQTELHRRQRHVVHMEELLHMRSM